MIAIFKFIFFAILARHAYIDLDGCLLKKFPVPKEIQGGLRSRLEWWNENLQPTEIVKSRLVICYLLRLFGVKLFIWSNRGIRHTEVTKKSLGLHSKIFSVAYYYEGNKNLSRFREGPCMDDDVNFIGSNKGDLLVESK